MSAAVDAIVLLVAALMCATALVADRRQRIALQAIVVSAMASAGILTGSSWAEVATIGALLVTVAAVATGFTAQMRAGSIRTSADDAPRRRTELLDTVRELPSMEEGEAVVAVCASLRSLGFDGGSVSLVRGGRLVSIGTDGVERASSPLPLETGLAGRAVLERRTVTATDYLRDPDRLPWVSGVGSSLCAPIWIGQEVVGVVVAVREEAGLLSAADSEVAEVLAAHLGAVMATKRSLQNQRTLVERMDRLDSMRTAFADEVSDELRDPLTIVRGAGHTLLAHGDSIDAESRTRLLDRMCEQADQLRQVIDALLDFSRFQAAHHDAQLRTITVGRLLGPLDEHLDLDGLERADIEVEADPELIRHAIELLLAGRRARAVVVDDGWSATISLTVTGREPHALMRSLVAQLVVEGGGIIDLDVSSPTITLLLADRTVEAAL